MTAVIVALLLAGNESLVIPGELAVTFKDVALFCDAQSHCSIQAVTRARVDELNARIGATVLSTIPGTQTYLMGLPRGMSLDEGIAFYKASGLILGVARNYRGTLSKQWSCPRRGQGHSFWLPCSSSPSTAVRPTAPVSAASNCEAAVRRSAKRGGSARG
jgi:hypothetical protein